MEQQRVAYLAGVSLVFIGVAMLGMGAGTYVAVGVIAADCAPAIGPELTTCGEWIQTLNRLTIKAFGLGMISLAVGGIIINVNGDPDG